MQRGFETSKLELLNGVGWVARGTHWNDRFCRKMTTRQQQEKAGLPPPLSVLRIYWNCRRGESKQEGGWRTKNDLLSQVLKGRVPAFIRFANILELLHAGKRTGRGWENKKWPPVTSTQRSCPRLYPFYEYISFWYPPHIVYQKSKCWKQIKNLTPASSGVIEESTEKTLPFAPQTTPRANTIFRRSILMAIPFFVFVFDFQSKSILNFLGNQRVIKWAEVFDKP